MDLKTLLAQRKTEIVNKWHKAVLETYDPDTAAFYKTQEDAFSNPVGSTMLQGLSTVFHSLLKPTDPQSIRTALDPLIRIRAVQNFKPSQATSFLLILKTIIRSNFKSKFEDHQIQAEFRQIEAQIDTLMLIAFDIYMECREKIYELKANVEKKSVYKAFSRAGLINDIADEMPDSTPG